MNAGKVFEDICVKKNIDECHNVTCRNNGKCIDLVADFLCVCPIGFDGRYCENNIDDCTNQSCIHGSCVDRVDGFECQCGLGFAGRYCQVCQQINTSKYNHFNSVFTIVLG